MEITVEISYYPLMVDHLELVEQFLQKLAENKRVKLEIGTMSSLIIGTYDEVMELLKVQLKPFLEKYPSIFTFKISNACSSCK